MPTFTVNFLVKAILGVDICAENSVQALEKAERHFAKKTPFRDGLEYIDGQVEVIGFTRNDKWAQTQREDD
jgi:hypothetical protein